MILSVKAIEVIVVRVLFMRPEVDLDGAGKGDG